MMWQTVTIQSPTKVIGSSGGRTPSWADVPGLVDLQARVLAVLNEDHDSEMTVLEDAYEVHVRGVHAEITTRMRVLDGSTAYDIRRVVPPPPFGSPVVVLETVKVGV